MLSRIVLTSVSSLIYLSYASVFFGQGQYFNWVSMLSAIAFFFLGYFCIRVAMVLPILLLVGVYYSGFPSWHSIGFVWQLSCSVISIVLSGVLWRSKGKIGIESGLSFWLYPVLICTASLWLLPDSGVASFLFSAPWTQTFSEIIWQVPTHDHYSYAQCIRIVLYSSLACLMAMTVPLEKIVLGISIGLLSSIMISIADGFGFIDIAWLPNNKAYNGLFDTTYGNYNWYVQVLIPGAIIFLGSPFFKAWKPLARWALCFLLVAYILLMGSRIALGVMILCIVAALVLLSLRAKKEFWELNKLRTLYSLAVFVAFAFVVTYVSYVNSWGDSASKISNLFQSERFDHWKNALNMIKLNPVSGYGLDSYHRVDIELTKAKEMFGYPYKRVGYFFKDTPHNEVLSLYQGIGVFGLLLWLVLVLIAIKGSLNSKIKGMLPYSIFFALAAMIILVAFQEMNYIGPVGFLAFLIISFGLKEIKNKRKWHLCMLFLSTSGLISYAANSDQEYLDRLDPAQSVQIKDLSKVLPVGLYDWEDWPSGKTRWTAGYAKEIVYMNKPILEVTLKAGGPHTKKGRKVEVEVEVNGKNKKTVMVGRDFSEKIVFNLPEYESEFVKIVYRVKKCFYSDSFNIAPNYRILGVALGEYKFTALNE